MKLSKKDKMQLDNILFDLQKTKKFILNPDKLICNKTKGKPYGTDYVNKEGEGISPIFKEAGSELCYLFNAIDKLNRILNPPEVTVTKLT